jgi:ArsR family metal-binding transcriptional regulator
MYETLTTFPNMASFSNAESMLKTARIDYHLISPSPAYRRIGTPAIAVTMEAKKKLLSEFQDFMCSGWIDYSPPSHSIPQETPEEFDDDIIKNCGIMVLAPCVADYKKIRLIVHFGNDISNALPYLNTEMPQGMYNRETDTFSFMDAYRMISIHAYRLTIAKADDIVDAWRVMGKIRCLLNDAWRRRDTIQPSYEMRQKPPALEIYKRLPGTNCRACGEKTCMAFALRLWGGEAQPDMCQPIFEGEYRHLKEAFLEICSGLGHDTEGLM